MKRTILLAMVVVTIAGVGTGCSTSRRVSYGDPTRVETLTEEWGSTDMQTVAERMVGSLVRHPIMASGRRPVVQVATVKNKTSEHIDTKSITDKIRTALVKTGMVRFTAVSDANRDILDTLDYQSGSGVVDPRTAKGPGRQIGSDYLLYGEITSIVKQSGRDSDVFYKITLNLADVSTGIIEWTDEKEIRKQAQRAMFGG